MFLRIKWFLLLLLNLSTNYLINFPLAPIVVLFANKEGWLPTWLWYFQTPDNPLDGDAGWQKKKPYPKEKNKYQRWVNRFSWLHRNKLYGFSQAVLGIKYNYDTDTFKCVGDPEIRNTPSPAKSGTVRRYLFRNGKLIAFQFYYIRQYKKWPKKCIRLNIGWKLWNFENRRDYAASFVFSPSPWMSYDA